MTEKTYTVTFIPRGFTLVHGDRTYQYVAGETATDVPEFVVAALRGAPNRSDVIDGTDPHAPVEDRPTTPAAPRHPRRRETPE